MYLVAFSGGLDSTVLLHKLVQTYSRDQLRAIHINHALYPESDHWQEHCQHICKQYDIPLICIKLTQKPPEGESIEAWARDQRRKNFVEHLQENEILMTAQHADDQAETVLLQLIRGAGPKGLSAMPQEKILGQGKHIRPLLQMSKQAILAYATEHQLTWINDHSNQDLQFDRNFLRQQIIPVLKDRWPSIEQTLSRSAAHCAQQQDLLELLLTPIYGMSQGSKPGTLSIKALLDQPPIVQRAIIRHWLSDKDFPMMGHKKFEKIFEDLIPARQDANPLIVWADVCIRRYRDDLYALPFAKLPLQQKQGLKKVHQAAGTPPWERSYLT